MTCVMREWWTLLSHSALHKGHWGATLTCKKRHGMAAKAALHLALLVSEHCHFTLAHWQDLLIYLKGTKLLLMLLITPLLFLFLVKAFAVKKQNKTTTVYMVGTAPETSQKTKWWIKPWKKKVLCCCCCLLAHRLYYFLLVQNGSRFEIVHTIELVHRMELGLSYRTVVSSSPHLMLISQSLLGRTEVVCPHYTDVWRRNHDTWIWGHFWFFFIFILLYLKVEWVVLSEQINFYKLCMDRVYKGFISSDRISKSV